MSREIAFEIDGSLVILDGPVKQVKLDGRLIYYREGVWCEKDDNGEYMPDWSLTWFYEDKDHPEDYLYYEQGVPEVASHNLSTMLSKHN